MPAPATTRHLGKNAVVESGCALLGGDDSDFSIQIYDLTFTIAVTSGQSSGPVEPIRQSRDKMLIRISTWYSSSSVYKFKVGNLEENDLYLALYVEPIQNFHKITYTFSLKKP
jgi:hypothetical protein